MNVFKFSFKTFKRTRKESISYSLVLLFSILVSFLFIDIGNNSVLIETDRAVGGAIWEEVSVPLSFALPFIVVVICWLMMIYASTYYFNKKVNEISMILISGGSIMEIVKYMLYQICFNLIYIIPISFLLGTVLLKYIYIQMYSYLNIPQSVVHIDFSSYIITLYSLIPIIACVVISLIGFCLYKHTIQELICRSNQNLVREKKHKMRFNIFFIMLYFFGLLMIVIQEHSVEAYIVPCIVGVISMIGIVRKVIPSLTSKLNTKVSTFVIAFANYSNSIQESILPILLLLTLVSVLVPIFISQNKISNEYATCFLSYIMIIILLCMSIIFKFLNNIINRKEEFKSLNRIGYISPLIKRLILQEMLLFYITILILPFVYILVIGLKFILNGDITLLGFLFLNLVHIFSLFFSFLITYYFYKKIILNYIGGNNNGN